MLLPRSMSANINKMCSCPNLLKAMEPPQHAEIWSKLVHNSGPYRSLWLNPVWSFGLCTRTYIICLLLSTPLCVSERPKDPASGDCVQNCHGKIETDLHFHSFLSSSLPLRQWLLHLWVWVLQDLPLFLVVFQGLKCFIKRSFEGLRDFQRFEVLI